MDIGIKTTLLVCLGVVMVLAMACLEPETDEPQEEEPFGDMHYEPSTSCVSNEAPDASNEEKLERAREVRLKYDDLLTRQPNVLKVRESYFFGGDVGIEIEVSEFTNQETLSPEDRLPGCLDGVPVQVVKPGPIRLCGGCREMNEERQ